MFGKLWRWKRKQEARGGASGNNFHKQAASFNQKGDRPTLLLDLEVIQCSSLVATPIKGFVLLTSGLSLVVHWESRVAHLCSHCASLDSWEIRMGEGEGERNSTFSSTQSFMCDSWNIPHHLWRCLWRRIPWSFSLCVWHLYALPPACVLPLPPPHSFISRYALQFEGDGRRLWRKEKQHKGDGDTLLWFIPPRCLSLEDSMMMVIPINSSFSISVISFFPLALFYLWSS